MIRYRKGKLLIKSDFQVRTIKGDGKDIDLFIPTDYRTLNLHIEGLPEFVDGRIQLNEVRNIMIRFSMMEDNNYCTLHFLRSIDLQSATMNFVIDYSQHYIKIKKEDYGAEMYILKG